MSSDDSSSSLKERTVRAKLLGERIDIKSIRPLFTQISTAPFTFKTNKNSILVVFRYGVIVFFGADDNEISEIIEKISPFVSKSYDSDSEESSNICFKNEDNVDSSGSIILKDNSVERFQVCAEILAKSVILNRYENKVSQVFENVEPLAENLKNKGRSGSNLNNLNRQTGEIILSMTQTIGRAEISEKPDVLWEHPELERLYVKLAEEYEIRERSIALQQKLDTASKAINSFVDLGQHNHMSVLVWYVIILIAIAIAVGFI